MTLVKGRLIIIVIRGITGVFVVAIFILQGAAFTRWVIRFAAENKNVTLCMRAVRRCCELEP